MRVAVFCSCSDNVSPMILSEIESVGEFLAQEGHETIYGGSSAGCMGALARGVLSHGGRLIGVVPKMDFMLGVVQQGLTEQHVVPTLTSRKQAMNELADVFVVYPGGMGTLDEAFEVLALKSSGIHVKPIYFYNFLGVWSPLLEALDLMAQQGFIRQPLAELLQVVDKVAHLRENLKDAV